MKLILLRHGESQWNLENRFTGWKDVPLTSLGIKEAEFSGKKILQEQISIHSLYTSFLKRASHTAEIVSSIIGFNKENIQYNWRLNERHYGALEGLNKSETALKYGEEQVHIWRRSYDIPPPSLSLDDERYLRDKLKYKSVKESIPKSESLKDVIKRIEPFWNDFSENLKINRCNHMIVAHSNSLRAIIKILENLSDREISSVNLPTGVPLIYDLDEHLNVLSKKFLIDEVQLKNKINIIKNQGKINES